jgi:periodic tryptophan protein 2
MNCLSYSSNGQLIATGGDDGKVKVWNVATGFCVVTFTEHTAPVTAVAFNNKNNAIFTASMDGTIRAFDLIRYRNFRTMTAPQPTQFSCIALDAANDIVCAGGGGVIDQFDIYIWSVQTGKLLDVLSGHTAPISSISFAPSTVLGSGKMILGSVSWDKSLILWDVFEGKPIREQLTHSHDIFTLAWRPDGKMLATATLDGNINLWDTDNAYVPTLCAPVNVLSILILFVECWLE